MTLPPLVEVISVVLANVAVAWLVTYLLHSTLLIVVAWLADGRTRLSGADRAFAWRVALVAPMCSASIHVAVGREWAWLSLEPSSLVSILGSHTALSIAVAAGAGLFPCAVLLMLLLGQIRLNRALGWRTPAQGSVLLLFNRVCAAAHYPASHLTVSTRTVVPAAVGLTEICVPAEFSETLSSCEQEALLAHEVAHLARRDPVWLAAATALTRVLLIQPLNRLALRRLREASERAADEFAVRITRDPVALARALANLATVVVATAGTASASGSPLFDRVTRLLSAGGHHESRIESGVARLLLASAVVMLVGLATPGVSVSAGRSANAIPWLTPSTSQPNARMLEVRQIQRAFRDGLRRHSRIGFTGRQ